MPAVIDTQIPQQNFELIRDRIAAVLATELAQQTTLGTTGLPNKVYTERIAMFEGQEGVMLNVSLDSGKYMAQTVKQTDGIYKYNIDAYATAKATPTTPGDTAAALLLERLLGICRYIIEDSRYLTLGFTPGFIMHRHIQTIQVGAHPNLENIVIGRLVLEVKAAETVALPDAVELAQSNTQAMLYCSTEGYYWSTTNADGGTPDPGCYQPPTPPEPEQKVSYIYRFETTNATNTYTITKLKHRHVLLVTQDNLPLRPTQWSKPFASDQFTITDTEFAVTAGQTITIFYTI